MGIEKKIPRELKGGIACCCTKLNLAVPFFFIIIINVISSPLDQSITEFFPSPFDDNPSVLVNVSHKLSP